jgi:hypothetical protein
MSEPIQVTEKDLYAMIGEQALVIRYQEQVIARLQEELAGSGRAPGTDPSQGNGAPVDAPATPRPGR